MKKKSGKRKRQQLLNIELDKPNPNIKARIHVGNRLIHPDYVRHGEEITRAIEVEGFVSGHIIAEPFAPAESMQNLKEFHSA